MLECAGSKVLHYADDTIIYTSNHNINTATDVINRDLVRAYEWLNVNKLKLNFGKTQFIIFSTHHNLKDFSG